MLSTTPTRHPAGVGGAFARAAGWNSIKSVIFRANGMSVFLSIYGNKLCLVDEDPFDIAGDGARKQGVETTSCLVTDALARSVIRPYRPIDTPSELKRTRALTFAVPSGARPGTLSEV
jgi:hypothetical protein